MENKIISSCAGISGPIGILGGTFDPVHNDHLAMAQIVAKHFSLNKVIFVPSFQNPLKAQPHATTSQRLEMLKLALEDEPDFLIYTHEIDRQVLYTIDTVHAIQQQAPNIELYLMHGADCLQTLAKWHSISKLLDLVNFVVVARSGYLTAGEKINAPGLLPDQLAKLEKYRVDLPAGNTSSSFIKECLLAGKMPETALAPQVLNYIQNHALYGYISREDNYD